MTIYLRTAVTAVGPEAADMIEGGVLILFADGAPPELAEISVLHKVVEGPTPDAPAPGCEILIGGLSAVITGMGSAAWAKVRDIGHVVINFNGEDAPERPGEICASPVNAEALVAAFQPGVEITIAA